MLCTIKRWPHNWPGGGNWNWCDSCDYCSWCSNPVLHKMAQEEVETLSQAAIGMEFNTHP